MKQKKSEKADKKNIWKIVALIFIGIFILIIAGGLIRSYYFRPHFIPLSEQQIDSAKTAVYNDLAGKGINAPMESIKVANEVRPIRPDKEEKKIIEVSAEVDSIRHIYLIDANSNEILMHSQTEFFSWMNDSKLFPSKGMRENRMMMTFPRLDQGR